MKRENFTNQPFVEHFKELYVKVYYAPECGFCKQYKKLLQEHGLLKYATLIDVSKARGKLEFDTLGEPGVPVTYSEKTENKVAGLPKDIPTLIEKLQDTPQI